MIRIFFHKLWKLWKILSKLW